MSSKAKIAFAPSKPPSLSGVSETGWTPMRSAVRLNSASFSTPGPLSFIWPAAHAGHQALERLQR